MDVELNASILGRTVYGKRDSDPGGKISTKEEKCPGSGQMIISRDEYVAA